MTEKVKLMVCNEPQNCETVKELEASLEDYKIADKYAKTERDALKEQNAELERWGERHRATIKEWGLKLNEAEAEVATLKEQLKFRESMDPIIGKRIEVAESRLAKAQDVFKDIPPPICFTIWANRMKKALGGDE